MSKKIYNQPIYKLRDCIPSNKLNGEFLSANPSPAAMKLISKPNNIPYINWNELSYNPSDEAINLLAKNPDKINGDNLSLNPNDRAFHLLEKYPDKINWKNILLNRNTDKVVNLLLKYPTNINMVNWPIEINDIYIDYIEENFLDGIPWEILAKKLILKPCDKGILLIIKYYAILYKHYKEKEKFIENVCMINDDRIIHLLFKYPYTINWSYLVKNPNNQINNNIQKSLVESKIMVKNFINENIEEAPFVNRFSIYFRHDIHDNIYKKNTFWENLMGNSNYDTIINLMKIFDFDIWVKGEKKYNCLKILAQNNNEKIIKFMIEKDYINQLSNDNGGYKARIYKSLCSNSCDSAIRLLNNNKEYLYSTWNILLAQNSNEKVFHLLQELIEKPNSRVDFNEKFWISLCKNKSSSIFDFIKNNFHRINLKEENEVKKAFQHLLFRKDSIDFVEYYLDNERIKNLYLSGNTRILDNFLIMLDWEILSQNPEIFVLDKEAMLNNFEPLAREIINYSEQKMEKLIENILEVKNIQIEDNLLSIEEGITDNKKKQIKEENSDDEITSIEDAESI